MDSVEDVQNVLQNAWENDQNAIRKGDIEYSKKVFLENTNQLKLIINKVGWPFRDKFGEKAASQAWLIAQHSDFDPKFQLQCMAFIISEMQIKKETKLDFVYLLDRVLLNLGANQIFGTQLDGRLSLPETLSPNQLSEIRKRVDLEPIEEYLERMKKYRQSINSKDL